MIVEVFQLIDFIASGRVRLLFIFFLIHLLFITIVRHYSLKYAPYASKKDLLARYRVSIIMSIWKEDPEVLRSAISSALRSGAHEIIVAYSTIDKSACEVLSSFNDERVKHITYDRRVPKKVAIYDGIRKSTGDIIVIQDSDTIINENSISEICKPFDDPRVGGAVAKIDILNPDHLAGKLSKIIEESRCFINRALTAFGRNVHVLDSRLCAYRREAVLPVLDEYLNDRFLGIDVVIGEDKMMTYLLQKNGWQCVYQETSTCLTTAPNSFAGFLKQQLRWARSGYLNFFRHTHCYRLNPLLAAHILLYYISPLVFPLIVFYDIFLMPPIFHVTPVLNAAIVVTGISLITLTKGKLKGIGLSLRDVPIIGLIGLFVMIPLLNYALITVWKVDNWLSR